MTADIVATDTKDERAAFKRQCVTNQCPIATLTLSMCDVTEVSCVRSRRAPVRNSAYCVGPE